MKTIRGGFEGFQNSNSEVQAGVERVILKQQTGGFEDSTGVFVLLAGLLREVRAFKRPRV
eukprot:5687571-Karenia_brevis.AAC.1